MYNGDDSKIYLPGDKFIVPETDCYLDATYRSNPAPELEIPYEVDEENKMMKNVCLTTIEKYLSNITLPRNYEAIVYDKDGNMVTDGHIATMYTTKIYDNGGLEVARYTNSVLGDPDGDGMIKSRDVSYTLQYVVGMRKLDNNDPRVLAMDFDKNGEIKVNDARAIQHTVVRNMQ